MAIIYEYDGVHESMHCDKCKITAKYSTEIFCHCGAFNFDYDHDGIVKTIKLPHTKYIAFNNPRAFKVKADV